MLQCTHRYIKQAVEHMIQYINNSYIATVALISSASKVATLGSYTAKQKIA